MVPTSGDSAITRQLLRRAPRRQQNQLRTCTHAHYRPREPEKKGSLHNSRPPSPLIRQNRVVAATY